MSNRTFVIGVGMTKFEKPGTKEGDYPDWAKEAGEKALADAGIPYDDVEQAYAGYCYGDSTYGQRALYQLGLTGIPVVNVNNNCSTGSSALFLARQAVKGGLVDCALALGFEKMEPGSLGVKYTDRTNALDKHAIRMFEIRDPEASPPAPQMFGNAGRDHMEKYGSNPDHYAWIGWKNHKHSVNNPYAQFQDEYSLEDIKDAKMIHDPLTKLQCSPTSDGSACAIVASERYVDEHGLGDQAIEIAGQSMVTDLSSTFAEDADCMTIVGSDMSKTAADRGLRRGRHRRRGSRRLRAARLLQRQRADHLRSARLRRRGRGAQAGRGRGDHLRRQGRRQPLRRPDLQGPPARGDRPRAVLRADLAAARRSRQAPGRRRQGRPAAQHRPRRRRRGHRLQAGRARGRGEESTMAKERRALGGKVVAITGGARGIGKATATALVRKGCRVAIGDLDLALAEQTAAELGGGTVALPSTSPTAPPSPTSSTRPSASSARSTWSSTTPGSCRSRRSSRRARSRSTARSTSTCTA